MNSVTAENNAMFSELLQALSSSPELALASVLGSLGIVAVLTIVVTSTVSYNWRKVRMFEEENALKQAMLDRGLSADEIATVVRAKRKGSWDHGCGKGSGDSVNFNFGGWNRHREKAEV